MRKIVRLGGLVATVSGSLACTHVHAEETEIDVSTRWRYQDVSDPVFGDTSANTMLLRLNFQAQVSDTTSAFVQGDHSFSINTADYSDGVILRNASFIPDAEVTEFNQFWLAHELDIGGVVTFGRQILKSDNERHLGGNSFWQNEQSFDAISYRYESYDGWQMSYSYLHRVNRIFGREAGRLLNPEDIRSGLLDERPAIERGVHDHRSHLLEGQYDFTNTLKLSGFFYALDNETFSGFSSYTLGLRLEGSHKPENIKYSYRVEAATQTDAFDSTWDYRAQYYALTLGAQINSHKIELAYENIGDDNGRGFVHSLGSNHQFQGWADVFDQYQKPNGMADTSLVYRGRNNRLRWRAKYHIFQSSDHQIDAGKELDLELAWRFAKDWEASAILAHYRADDGFPSLLASQQNKRTWFVSLKYNL